MGDCTGRGAVRRLVRTDRCRRGRRRRDPAQAAPASEYIKPSPDFLVVAAYPAGLENFEFAVAA